MAIDRKIKDSSDVESAIKELQLKIKVQEADIQEQFADVKYNLQPKRVINNGFNYLAETPEVQKVIINIAIGFIIGFASKKAAQFIGEDSLNRTVENMVGQELNKLENKDPDSFLSRIVTLLRKNTPPTSPIYPLVKYR